MLKKPFRSCTKTFSECIDVFMSARYVRILIMGNIINVVFLDELLVDNPGNIRYDFVYPTTMAGSFASFGMGHDTPRFMHMDLFIRADTNEEIHGREGELSLTKLQSVTNCEAKTEESEIRSNGSEP
jgi:hypothetical protein